MSDTGKTDRPSGGISGDDSNDANDPRETSESGDTPASASKQKKTLLGSGPKLTPPPRRSLTDSSQQAAKRKSLSARLRKLTAQTSDPEAADDESSNHKSERPKVPPTIEVELPPDFEGDEPEEPATDRLESLPFEIVSADMEGGAETDRLESLPFEPTLKEEEGADGRQKQKSTAMMHSVGPPRESAGESNEEAPTDPSLDQGEFEGEKTELVAGLVDESKTSGGGVDIEGDFEEEKTQLSPGLVDAEQFPSDHHFETDAPEGLVESTDASTPPAPTAPKGKRVTARLDSPPKPQPATPGHAAPPSDDDFDGHDTEIFQSPFDSDPICPRLSTLEGPTAGQDYLINRMRNSIGRGTSNSAIVADLAMSRKHFEILQQSDDSYQVRDLRSVNGTALNGVKIKEADLFHGDRIEAGHSVFQFTIPGDVPVNQRQRRLIPAETTTTLSDADPDDLGAPVTSRSGQATDTVDRILLVITITAGLLSVLLVGFLLFTTLADDDSDITVTAPELYFDGVEALQNRQWDSAEDYFRQSAELDPNFGEVEAQLARIEEERQAQAIVDKAHSLNGAALDRQTIDQLRSISRESNYFDDAQSLLSLARHGEARALFEQAQLAYEEGDLDTSLAALNELLAVAPRHEGAEQLQEAIEEALDQEEAQEQAESRTQGAHASAQPQQQTARPAQRPQPAGVDGDDDDSFINPFQARSERSEPRSDQPQRRQVINFTDGFSHYRAGDFDEAIAHFEAIAEASSGAVGDRATRTASDIRSYRDSLAAGLSAKRAGRFDEAVQYFQSARQADVSVGGDGGYFGDQVADYLAETLAEDGLARLEGDDYSGAYASLERARAHSSRQAKVRDLSRQLENQANALYIRAANQRLSDPEGAADLCRTILTMIPPSSDIHQRARQMLDELN